MLDNHLILFFFYSDWERWTAHVRGHSTRILFELSEQNKAQIPSHMIAARTQSPSQNSIQI
jgi:hypothetical protein